MKEGIDLSEFYKSVEWDILGVPAARSVHCTVSAPLQQTPRR